MIGSSSNFGYSDTYAVCVCVVCVCVLCLWYVFCTVERVSEYESVFTFLLHVCVVSGYNCVLCIGACCCTTYWDMVL